MEESTKASDFEKNYLRITTMNAQQSMFSVCKILPSFWFLQTGSEACTNGSSVWTQQENLCQIWNRLISKQPFIE